VSRFVQIDLSALTPPDVVETLDYEAIVAAIKADVEAAAPELADVLALESEPAVKLIEAFAYRELLLRQRVNDAAEAVMLARATSSDLDNLAALFGVERLTISPGDPEAVPPIAAVMETDDALRQRVQLSLEAQSVAGPEGAYLFHARAADERVRDASVISPGAGEVLVTVLASTGDGTAPQDLVDAVEAAVGAEDVRPLTDHVTVSSAAVVDYTIEAELTLYHGPDADVVATTARASAETFAARHHRIGHDITRSGLFAALHVEGVQRVELIQPAADIVVDDTQAAHCGAISVSVGGRDV